MQSSQASKFFQPGDLVFAKIRGYAAWPARVEKSYNNSKNPKQTRYQVFFYWSYQTAICTGKDMFDFHAKKAKLGKCGAWGFKEAMLEIQTKPDITFDPRQSNKKAAKLPVGMCTATTSTQSTSHKKRKSSAEAHGSTSKQQKLSNQALQQKLQLVRPCFVRLEYFDMKAYFSSKSAPSPPAAKNPGDSVKSSSPTKMVTKTSSSHDNKGKAPSKDGHAPVVMKTSQEESKSKTDRKDDHAPVVMKTFQEESKSKTARKDEAVPVVTKASSQDDKSKPTSNGLVPVTTKTSLQESKSKTPRKDEPLPVVTKTSLKDNKSKKPRKDEPVPAEKSTGKLETTCIFCDKKFEVYSHLYVHVRRLHGNYPDCRNCGKFFASDAEHRDHTSFCGISDKPTKPVQNIFNCTFCEKAFEDVPRVKLHMVLNHPRAANTLFLTANEQQLLETLKTIRNYLLKLSENNENFAVHCAQCKVDASPKDYFENHIERSPHPKKFICFICGTGSKDYPKHLEHLKSHCNDSFVLKKCDKCHCSFVNCSNQTTHFLNNHSNISASDVSLHYKDSQSKSVLNTEVECLEETPKQTVNASFQALEQEKPSSSKSSTDVESEAESTEYYMEIIDASKEVAASNVDIPIIELDQQEQESDVEDDDEENSSNSPETENETETSQNQSSSTAAQENVKNLLGLQKNELEGAAKVFKVHCSSCSNDIPDDIYFDFDIHYNDCIVHTELKCPFCGLEIPEKEKNLHDFFSHLDKHISRGMRSVECRKCSVWFFNLYNQTIHLGNIHSNTVGDNLKSLTTEEKKNPENSANATQQPSEVVPPRLRSGIKFKFELALHELIEFSNSQLQSFNKDKLFNIFCMSCSTDIPYKTYFANHIKTCEAPNSYLCNFCGRKFAQNNKYPILYIQHVKNHLVKPFVDYSCECNLSFMNMYNGILHTSYNKHQPESSSSSTKK